MVNLLLHNNVPLGIVAVALLIRWLVAQFPYSGNNAPPMFGDYEAQRHWMEITTNLPPEDWYKNTTKNDLLYWGLDYPPLTAYHMYALGYISNKFLNSSWTELEKSRGFESQQHKLFMRSTVILSDLLIYIPAVVYYFYKIQPIQYNSPPSGIHKQNIALYAALVLLYPGQILIDHGHFQYNCVFMGLVLWAVIFMSKGKKFTAALFFTLALSYKQMALYYSLPFFWYIASSNFRVRPIWKGFRNIILIGLLVISTFAILFKPFLSNTEDILQVMKRIFPFNRGLFEDKVANLWFSLSIFYKYRNLYTIDDLLKFSTLSTLFASLPAGLHLLFKPSIRAFKYALVTTSMVFFLLSFQVHEKTILVPALPILLMFREHPLAVNWFVIISAFSLQPLLMKDGQLIPYTVLLITYTLASLDIFRSHITLSFAKIVSLHNLTAIVYLTSIMGCFALSALAVFVRPPIRYPDLHPTLNALYTCAHLIVFLIFFYYRQFRVEPRRSLPEDRITLIKKTK